MQIPPPQRLPSSWFRMFPGAVRASDLSKKSETKTPEVFLHAAFDFDAPRPRNIIQKCKNHQKPDLKSRISKNDEIMV